MLNGCCTIGKCSQDPQLTFDISISIKIFLYCHEKGFLSFFPSNFVATVCYRRKYIVTTQLLDANINGLDIKPMARFAMVREHPTRTDYQFDGVMKH